MFAYCGNNPVNCADPSGHLFERLRNYFTNWVSSIKQAGQRIRKFFSGIKADFLNFRLFNTNEQSVLKSNYFSAYRGKIVFRINGDRSWSFGAIFLTRETGSRQYPEDVLRHEYGHTVQLRQLGVVKYALCIGIPSWLEWGSYGDDKYYSREWEITADYYGGVQSRTLNPDELKAGFDYLILSYYLGPISWCSIK